MTKKRQGLLVRQSADRLLALPDSGVALAALARLAVQPAAASVSTPAGNVASDNCGDR